MSAEVLTTIATGLAILGFGWRMYANLDRKIDALRNDVNRDLNGLRNDVNKDLNDVSKDLNGLRSDVNRDLNGLRNDVSNDLSGINGRLSAVEGKLELLVQGLHIEISGRGQA